MLLVNYYKNSLPVLNRGLLDVPEEEGAVSVSVFGSDSKLTEEGTLEELGISVSVAEGPTLLAKSAAPGFSLLMLQDFSALYPSFSSSASFEDRPYSALINDDSGLTN